MYWLRQAAALFIALAVDPFRQRSIERAADRDQQRFLFQQRRQRAWHFARRGQQRP